MQRPEDRSVPVHAEVGDYNLTATFADLATARQAAGALRLRGVAGEAIALDDAGAVPEVDEARMRDELEGSAVATKSMISGAATGGVIGAVAGGIIGLVLGLLIFGGGVGMVATIVGVGFGLGIAGAVAGGFSKPREDPAGVEIPGTPGGSVSERAATQPGAVRAPAAQGVVLQVHLTEPEQFADAEDVLVHAGPLRVDRFTETGQVVGTEELGLDAPPVQPGSGRIISER
ncbi:MAG: hypothetical protein ACRDJU_09455 [Actinomycetota bacterium]